MTRPSHDTILAFLEGRLDAAERERLLASLDRDAELAAELRAAAVGLEAAESLVAATVDRAATDRSVPAWWVAVAAAVALLVAVPTTALWTARGAGTLAPLETLRPAPSTAPRLAMTGGPPVATGPSYVLVLHGRWSDAGAVEEAERQARAVEYWRWAESLAEDGVLVAAGDLRWEPGHRLAPGGEAMDVASGALDDPDYIVGMFTLRVDDDAEALAIARACPHLAYGGSVSVRRVGSGFVTVPGMGDWGAE